MRRMNTVIKKTVVDQFNNIINNYTINDLIKHIKEALEIPMKNDTVTGVVLHGSYLYGTNEEHSPIDIAIILNRYNEEPLPFFLNTSRDKALPIFNIIHEYFSSKFCSPFDYQYLKYVIKEKFLPPMLKIDFMQKRINITIADDILLSKTIYLKSTLYNYPYFARFYFLLKHYLIKTNYWRKTEYTLTPFKIFLLIHFFYISKPHTINVFPARITMIRFFQFYKEVCVSESVIKFRIPDGKCTVKEKQTKKPSTLMIIFFGQKLFFQRKIFKGLLDNLKQNSSSSNTELTIAK